MRGKKTKVLSVVLLFFLVSAFVVFAGGKQETTKGTTAQSAEKPMVMAMMTNQSGLGDQAFNDATWAGFKLAEKKLGITPKVMEAREQAQYVPDLTALVNQKCDLVVAVGFMCQDAVKDVAKMYPKAHFGIVDGTVDLPNVASLHFREEQGAFLMGAIAAKMTKTGIVGFVGGMSTPITNKFEAGYRAGVMTANPKVKVLVSYAGTFADPAKGEVMAMAEYNQGADVVFQVAGQTGMGVINAAKKVNKWAIGVDRDQNYLAPNNVLSSMVKRLDIAVFNLIKTVKEGQFKGGVYTYGLKVGGVEIAPTTSKNVPQDVIDYVNKLKSEIIAGKIVPPATLKALKSFTPTKS